MTQAITLDTRREWTKRWWESTVLKLIRFGTDALKHTIFYYQEPLSAFFFGGIATKKKALQKRNGGFACAAGATARGVSHAFSCLTYVSHLLRKNEK